MKSIKNTTNNLINFIALMTPFFSIQINLTVIILIIVDSRSTYQTQLKRKMD